MEITRVRNKLYCLFLLFFLVEYFDIFYFSKKTNLDVFRYGTGSITGQFFYQPARLPFTLLFLVDRQQLPLLLLGLLMK
jgi:hypothetical protein